MTYFTKLSKKELQDLARKSHESLRSPELNKAWAEKDNIRELYVSGVRAVAIADEYKIKVRQVYRILDITK